MTRPHPGPNNLNDTVEDIEEVGSFRSECYRSLNLTCPLVVIVQRYLMIMCFSSSISIKSIVRQVQMKMRHKLTSPCDDWLS